MEIERITFHDILKIYKAIFIIAILLVALRTIITDKDKIQQLEAENYNQYVEIDSLRETIYKYERGEENVILYVK